MIYDQQEFAIRCEWGPGGVEALALISDVVIIVDVLSFSTSVDIATGRGASVYPYRGPVQELAAFAAARGAKVADRRRPESRYTLSPSSLLEVSAGARLVLPSPNGSALTLAAAGAAPVLAGCLRNAQAVAAAAGHYGSRFALIAAGERWRSDGSLRPGLEDLLGAGAIISYLAGERSPEAEGAAAVFEALRPRLADHLARCSSGKELIAKGYARDVELAAALNTSGHAPVLVDGAYVAGGG